MNDLSGTSMISTGLLSISGASKVCGVIGDPIAHSLSPQIHNAAFRSLAMDFVYVPFRVPRGELRAAIEGVRSLGMFGVNVTMPHKIRVLRFLDTIDKTAQEIGAVNTIVRNDDRLRGYNTDGQAALTSLLRLGRPLSGRKGVILGAGGAARAIAYHLSKMVETLVILNRTPSKGSFLAARITKWSGVTCRSRSLNRRNLRKEVGRGNLLINTLPTDVFPRFGRILIEERLVGRDMVVVDVNYEPKTDFLAKAELAGARVTDGLDMLIGQAALSFKLWTGRDAPIDVMREAAILTRAMW